MAVVNEARPAEFREALSRMKEIRRFLEMLPSIFQDCVSPPSAFSAARMADDLRKSAVVLDGLRRLGILVPGDFALRLQSARLSGDLASPL